jgi:hypothetical protein
LIERDSQWLLHVSNLTFYDNTLTLLSIDFQYNISTMILRTFFSAARVLFVALLTFLSIGVLYAQKQETIKYFPSDISYDPDFPTPESILGYQVGEWHVSHDQLVYYMKEMARLSDRITIKETGRTYENRPLQLLTITSPENHEKIDQIQADHVALSDPEKSASMDIANMPVVVWLGHSVHGNEPSGSNSSLLTVYHWAAAQGPKIESILENTVILVDPSINPDGLHRFSSWVNSNKGNNASPDPDDREHNEVWPRGRTNHYWFDLNRDWLPVQHPESKARMAKYHQWKPNIVTDHHEMGSNSTFFFQPGVPSRNNPLIPKSTIELTGKIAEYHVAELDKIGSYYYSKEGYDDFYFGKGSTYPDINGAVGILFEQASSRGHVQNTANGKLTFPFTIKNQYTTDYSTVLAANGLKTELLQHQKTFYETALKEAVSDPVKGYIWSVGKDLSKSNHFLDMLLRHQLEVYKVGSNQRVEGKTFDRSNSYVVPLGQPNYRVVKAIFEKRTTFQDSLFYDVSAWTIPLAMNLNYAEMKGKVLPNGIVGDRVLAISKNEGNVDKSKYAYVLRWDDYYSPKVLNMILAKGIIAKVSTKVFSSKDENYDLGTILIPVSNQKISPDDLFVFLKEVVSDTGISIEAIRSGNTSGVNLGSGSFQLLRNPKVAILTDGGVSGYDAGEVWHLLDYRMDMSVTLLPTNRVAQVDLSKYNTIIMVNGSYGALAGNKLKSWIQAGGLVVASRSAGKWLSDNKFTKTTYKPTVKTDSITKLPYAHQIKYSGAQRIGGAIFNTTADLTHPILYGIENENVPVFRRGSLVMKPDKGQYANPLMYTEKPLIAGYISPKNHKELGGSAAVSVSSYGSGRIITFADNPNFRAFWYGTNKLFLNSIFFGPIISSSSTK